MLATTQHFEGFMVDSLIRASFDACLENSLFASEERGTFRQIHCEHVLDRFWCCGLPLDRELQRFGEVASKLVISLLAGFAMVERRRRRTSETSKPKSPSTIDDFVAGCRAACESHPGRTIAFATPLRSAHVRVEEF